MAQRREISVRKEDVEPTIGKLGGRTYVLMGEHEEGHWVHLLDLPPGCGTEAHYHEYDQFQVIISGSLNMAGEILLPGSVHYTDARVPYGPFTAGPEGCSMMIIRPGAPEKGPQIPVSATIEKVKLAQQRLSS